MAAGNEPLSDHTMVTSHARRSSCKRYGNAAMTTASNPNEGSSIAKLRKPSGSFQAPTDETLNATSVPGDGACGYAVACRVARMQCELVVLLHAELPGVPVSMVNWPASVKAIASRVIVAATKHHVNGSTRLGAVCDEVARGWWTGVVATHRRRTTT